MIAAIEFKSVRDIWTKLPTREDARDFLEEIVWKNGRFCPHCGSLESGKIAGEKTRPGLYQCRDCRGQFTVTTKTPMHSTNLDLRVWIAAMFIVISSSKGISSVVMARLIGVNQKTAWKLGHAIREMMDRNGLRGAKLSGIVEVDEAYVGGAPKYRRGKKKNPPGRATTKPQILVAVARNGDARATIIPNGTRTTINPIVRRWISPSSTLMTDGNGVYRRIGRAFAAHHWVIHKQGFANPLTGTHINTAEAFNDNVKRAMVGVWHQVNRNYLQGYLDEIAWRWNRRHNAGVRNHSGHIIWRALPMVELMGDLLRNAPGRQLRRAKVVGLYRPSEIK